MGSEVKSRKQRKAHTAWPAVTDRLDTLSLGPSGQSLMRSSGHWATVIGLRSPHSKFGKTGAKFFFNFYLYCSTLFSPQYEGLCYSDAPL